jgi:hypothetical protein
MLIVDMPIGMGSARPVHCTGCTCGQRSEPVLPVERAGAVAEQRLGGLPAAQTTWQHVPAMTSGRQE